MQTSELFRNTGPHVQLGAVTKRYRTAAEEVQALQHIDWDAQPGKAIAIMGPSGCGKTTLLNLVGGMDRPSEGKVLVGGQNIAGVNERELETYRLKHVGFVFQFYNLIPSISALENVMLPMQAAGGGENVERARALLGLVGLAGKGGKRPEELSGGEQQRVSIAVALANDPGLILADEPTGNLDSVNASAIAGLLCALASDFGKTVIMVSHDPKITEQFPSNYAMRDGRFV